LKKIDLDSWNQKHHFNHFNALVDPYFAVDNFKYRIIDDEIFEYDVINASAMLSRADNTFGFSFTSQKEPFSGAKDSVPKFAYSKTYKDGERLLMNVGISANHALIDGCHIGRFAEIFQENLNRP